MFRPKSPRVAPAQKLRLIPTAPQAIEAVPEVSYPTPVLMVPPVDNSRRLDEFEDRLLHQEKTTQSLIDKAYKIKEDLVDAMGLSQGSWQTEKQARALLSDHIKNITVIVKRLSREIEVRINMIEYILKMFEINILLIIDLLNIRDLVNFEKVSQKILHISTFEKDKPPPPPAH